jgi:hypothetical protein
MRKPITFNFFSSLAPSTLHLAYLALSDFPPWQFKYMEMPSVGAASVTLSDTTTQLEQTLLTPPEAKMLLSVELQSQGSNLGILALG